MASDDALSQIAVVDAASDSGCDIAETLLPVHPVPSMQAAFEESIMDFTDAAPAARPVDKLDAHARRKLLLNLDHPDEQDALPLARPTTARSHPLWKLVAQIAFGIHLLHQHSAKSIQDVVAILQTHVDDIDDFLEDANADFDLAIKDIDERNEFLLLPLQHGATFDGMLADSSFRAAILDGNRVIHRIIARSTAAMHAALRDVRRGIDATADLAKYLASLGSRWTLADDKLAQAYNMMNGNAQGWHKCFKSTQIKGHRLARSISQLTATVGEVARRAELARLAKETLPAQLPASRSASDASRPQRLASVPGTPHHNPSGSASSVHSASSSNLDKPLPPMPSPTTDLALSVTHETAFSQHQRRAASLARRRGHDAPSDLVACPAHASPSPTHGSSNDADVEDDALCRVAPITTPATPARLPRSTATSRSASLRKPPSPPQASTYPTATPQLSRGTSAHSHSPPSPSSPLPTSRALPLYVPQKPRSSSLASGAGFDSAYSSGSDVTPPLASLPVFAPSTSLPPTTPTSVTTHIPIVRAGSVAHSQPLRTSEPIYRFNAPALASAPRTEAAPAMAMASPVSRTMSSPTGPLDGAAHPPRLTNKPSLRQRPSLASIRSIFGSGAQAAREFREKQAGRERRRGGAACFA